MTTPVSELLRAAREKVAMGWTQKTLARDISGRPVGENSPSACKWCMAGAIYASDPDKTGYFVDSARARFALQDSIGSSIEKFNDTEGRTQSEVLSAFDAAIAAEESK